MRQTGGTALGATSTRSRPFSCASASASCVAMTPSCCPSSSMTRTSRIRIISLTRRSLAIFYCSLTNRPPADTDGWPSSTRKRRATIPEQTFAVNESGRSVVRPLRLARVVVEDGDLASIRVGKPKRAASLPSVTGRRPHQREPALAQLLRPGVDLGGGLDSEADLDAIPRRPLAPSKAEFEPSQLEVDTISVRGPDLEAKGLLVEIGTARLLGRAH